MHRIIAIPQSLGSSSATRALNATSGRSLLCGNCYCSFDISDTKRHLLFCTIIQVLITPKLIIWYFDVPRPRKFTKIRDTWQKLCVSVTMYHRNSPVESTFRSPSDYHWCLSMLFFCFTFLRWPFYSISIRVSLAFSPTSIRTSREPSMRSFRVFLFETSLYVFLRESSWLSADLGRFLGYLRSQCYDASTSFLPPMLLFRDFNYEARSLRTTPRAPTSLHSFKSNRSTRNSQLTRSLDLFSSKSPRIATFFLDKRISNVWWKSINVLFNQTRNSRLSTNTRSLCDYLWCRIILKMVEIYVPFKAPSPWGAFLHTRFFVYQHG